MEQVAELEEALMICYFDYQSEKAKNEVLTQSLEEANEKVKILTGRNEDLRNKLKAKSKLSSSNVVKKAPFISSYVSSDFVLGALMRKLPKFPNRPHPSERRPVCRSDVNLKTYIESDVQTRKYTNKFLYLPERTVWCNQDEDQALAFGPLFFCDKNNRSVRGSTFAELYGKMFHLFILKDKLVYYAGFYKALDIRSIIPDGVRIGDFNGGVSPHGLAEATLSEAGDITLRTYRLHAISRLYQDGVLKAECMALHNVGFDYNLYERLSLRYAADALLEKGKPIMALRDPYYPHAELLADGANSSANSVQGNKTKRLRLE
ncbi:hypothetical protein CPC08DRAFT_268017 [Agrocybe pediades]|nr:hypothetical protein CPC08DRAFT_268017 [Agrocybe pediades]